MSESLEVFIASLEGDQKFDYFVCGVAGALFAYIGQTYTPHKIELSISLFEPASLILLALAFFAGLHRIQTVNVISRINHKVLRAHEEAARLTEQMASGGTIHYPMGGQILDRSSAEAFVDKRLKSALRMESKLLAQGKRSERLYKTRDRLLLCGFVAIFFSKVLQPYASAPSFSKAPQATETRTVSEDQTKAPPVKAEKQSPLVHP